MSGDVEKCLTIPGQQVRDTPRNHTATAERFVECFCERQSLLLRTLRQQCCQANSFWPAVLHCCAETQLQTIFSPMLIFNQQGEATTKTRFEGRVSKTSFTTQESTAPLGSCHRLNAEPDQHKENPRPKPLPRTTKTKHVKIIRKYREASKQQTLVYENYGYPRRTHDVKCTRPRKLWDTPPLHHDKKKR